MPANKRCNSPTDYLWLCYSNKVIRVELTDPKKTWLNLSELCLVGLACNHTCGTDYRHNKKDAACKGLTDWLWLLERMPSTHTSMADKGKAKLRQRKGHNDDDEYDEGFASTAITLMTRWTSLPPLKHSLLQPTQILQLSLSTHTFVCGVEDCFVSGLSRTNATRKSTPEASCCECCVCGSTDEQVGTKKWHW